MLRRRSKMRMELESLQWTTPKFTPRGALNFELGSAHLGAGWGIGWKFYLILLAFQ